MKNKTKMILSLVILLILSGLYQFLIGNKGAWIAGGLMIFGVCFGWYACKAQSEQGDGK